MSVKHLLNMSTLQADLNVSLTSDLQNLHKRINKLEALIELHEERYIAQLNKATK